MVVHRIREHVATYNWFAVGVDLIIVIVGVFIGIQASNWNAARIERGEVRAYRLQIMENLKANEQELAARGQYYRRVRAHALEALDSLVSDAPRGEAFLIDSYQATQYWPIWMQHSAYDEMIAGGMAKNFGDPAIRRRLSHYYAGLQRFEDAVGSPTAYRERVRRAMPYAVQQRIRERCNEIARIDANGFVRLSLLEHCRPQLPPALASEAAARLSKTAELEQDLTRHIGDVDQKIALFDVLLRRTRELRQHLEATERR